MYLTKIFCLTLTIALTACGGGSGNNETSNTVTQINTFDFRAGMAKLAATGFSKTLTISGTCSGTFTRTDSPVTNSTTFEGATALSGSSMLNMTVSNCTPASTTETVTRYFDSNYTPLGSAVIGSSYNVWSSPAIVPTNVKVGDVAVVGTINRYTNSTKSTPLGTSISSYVIEADTATTAIANIISKVYNTSNVLTATEQDRYRIATDGSLTLISIDIQYANNSTTHLVMN